MRTLLFWLCLTLLALAEGPRDFVVTMADLKGKLPAGYRINPKLEEFRERDFDGIRFYIYSYSDESRHFLVTANCVKHPSSIQAMLLHSSNGQARHSKDFSKIVRAGEVSHCHKFDGKAFWMFDFRQKRFEGDVMISGFDLTPREMNSLVRTWVARIDKASRRPRPKSKGFWFFAPLAPKK